MLWFITFLSAVLSPIPCLSTTTCADSTTYRFETQNNGVTRQRKCSWLYGNPAKIDYRTSKFCNWNSNGAWVADECPYSCNTCDTDSPSISPSGEGSPFPSTKPSGTPSAAPTTEDSSCLDSSTFTFEQTRNGQTRNRKCIWLTQKESQAAFRVSRYCSDTALSGDVVKEKCKTSCDNCPTEQPSSSPSQISQPSLEPSTSPSTKPSATGTSSPTVTNSPSYIPSNVPSDDPSTSLQPSSMPSTSNKPSANPSLLCEDLSTFRFSTTSNGFQRVRRCAWLTQNASKAASRIGKFCNFSSEDGVKVRDGCVLSCNNCT